MGSRSPLTAATLVRRSRRKLGRVTHPPRQRDGALDAAAAYVRRSARWHTSAATPDDVVPALLDHFSATNAEPSLDQALQLVDRATITRRPGELRALAAAHRLTGDPRYAETALRGAAAATAELNPVTLLEVAEATDVAHLRRQALDDLRRLATSQGADGFLPLPVTATGDRAQLHAVADTLTALTRAPDDELVEAGARTADALVRRFEIDGSLRGEYGPRWKPAGEWSCSTALARVSAVWLDLARRGAAVDAWYLNAALKMNDRLCGAQRRSGALHWGGDGSVPCERRGAAVRATAALCTALVAEQEARAAIGAPLP